MNSSKSHAELEGLDRKEFARVGPRRQGKPPHATRERREGFNAVFVAVLGMDGFAGTKFDGLSGDPDFLSL